MPPTDLHALTTYPNLGRYTGASNRSLSILLTCAWKANPYINRPGRQFGSPLATRTGPKTSSHTDCLCRSANASNVAASTTCFILRNSCGTDRSGNPASARIIFRAAISSFCERSRSKRSRLGHLMPVMSPRWLLRRDRQDRQIQRWAQILPW